MGITGTNFCRELTFDDVSLNRIDSHCGSYNLKVLNSKIGKFGLVIIGQNNLTIINTNIQSNQFTYLKDDYGSLWDGKAKIINSTYIIRNSGRFIYCKFSFESNGTLHDFGYDIKFPSLYINNLTIDNSYVSSKNIINIICNLNTKSQNITNITQSYFSDMKIVIDSFKFINTNFTDNSSSIISLNYSPFLLKNNIFISDLRFMYKNKEITSKMHLEKNLIFYDLICFSIVKNNYSNNYVSIYNDDNLYTKFKIEKEHNYFHGCFNNNENYKIYIDSVEIPFNYKGNIDYNFRIDKKGISGGIIFYKIR